MTVQLDPPLTEKSIAAAIMRDRWAKHFCLPNYTPAEWFECDVFQITSAGYWIEYEIKLSRSDFRVDADKEREYGKYEFGKDRPKENKHELLKTTDRGPSNFFYVTPPGLLKPEDLPPWAGLMEIAGVGRHLYSRTVVNAPRRHKNKVTDDLRKASMETCYWRMHRLL